MATYVKYLGKEKAINFMKDFDLIVDKYRKLADASGYNGVLKFQKEGGFTLVFVEVEIE